MSEFESNLIAVWLQKNQINRVDGYTGVPKKEKIIVLNSGRNKRDRKYSGQRIENFGKFIERNF